MKPYVVAFVFARGGSKGLPRKNLRLLGGKPLLAHAVTTARASRFIDRVVLSTDDAEIAEVGHRWGAEVPFLRPADLARDDTPEWLAWQHAIREVEARDGGRKLDLFISVPPTSPLRAVEDIDQCVRTALETDADVVVTVRPAERSPYFNMVVLDQGYARRVIEPAANTVHRRQDAPVVFDLTTVAYAARPSFVLSARSIFDGKVRAVPVPKERAVDIDDELDFAFAEFLMSR